MPLTPNFSASQNYGTPSVITLTDTSTGSDGTIAKRRVYMLQANGTYLVPAGTTTNYVDWSLADTSISLDVLAQDSALTRMEKFDKATRSDTQAVENLKKTMTAGTNLSDDPELEEGEDGEKKQ
jgi:hypothetical protein